MSGKSSHPVLSAINRFFFTGLLTIIPIWVTYLLVDLMLGLLIDAGSPLVDRLSFAVRPFWSGGADLLIHPMFQSILGILLIVFIILFIGWVSSRVIGRKLINTFESLVDRIPFVKSIYGSVKKLIAAMQQKPENVQRVVLIDFPSPEMKTVGLVTRTLVDKDTGRKLAAVYVPTTPNPTSGYLEIVPLEKVTSTNWTMDEAMSFIISGGAVAPAEMTYDKSVEVPDSPDESTE